MTEERKDKPRKIGTVVSDSMEKTITVKVTRLVKHPRYRKYVKRFTRLKAHDEANEAHVGDTVEVYYARPLSKTKFWRLGRIIERGSEQT
jgi:small subunit ribosomal protein S17